ncbi:unnamed protein product [Lactuca saligna]|uniref:Uncharacterized protein n=1 Tax=Lactuca saligna TaxID=75948 RepID=A0AA35ZU95_LACSI|nr:unnamed protein product [Lactuca saligna]
MDGGGFGGQFVDLKFDSEEQNFPYHMLMSTKQFKILNRKLNYILQSQPDYGAKNSISDVKTIREDVNRNLDEVKVNVTKELRTNYSSLQEKVDTITVVVTKLGVLLGEIKKLVLKPAQTSFLTPEFLTQKIQILDQAIQKAVAPISNFANLLPTGAPPVAIGVQRGENEKIFSKDAKTNKGGNMKTTQ